MDAHIKAGFAAIAIVLAGLIYFAACTANASPHVLRFQNPSPTVAYTSLRTPWGIVAAPCAPLATCSVVIDVPIGPRTITAEATADGAVWSARSNALEKLIAPAPAECLALVACRFDADGDGFVTGSDFSVLLGAFGSTWLP